ncbi:MAG: hypothetical protein EXR51_11210 [Dehalococcoidia bacterium]|nr:hypothetical protein [Dehalococcoidia bacterium]
MTPIEERFHEAMVEIYRRAKSEIGYNATRFLQIVSEYGGVGTARRLLGSADALQYGFTELWEHQRLDLTVEPHVLKPEFSRLFTDEEKDRPRARLEAHWYRMPES